MQESIRRINNQQYTNEKGNLVFSVPKLEVSVQKDSVYEGYVEVISQDEKTFKGYVYTSDYRMQCKYPMLSGKRATLHYRFDASGMIMGEVVKGEICLVTNFGHFFLPYQVEVPKASIQSSLGPVKNLFHFVNLAKTNWKEAINIFYSESFHYILTGADRHYLPAYFGLSKYKYNEQNMDEFLIMTNKKSRIRYSFMEQELVFDMYTLQKKAETILEKDGWGHIKVELETKGDFLRLPKTQLLEADFVGNRCTIPFEICEQNLHDGNNYGKILCKTIHETLELPIKVVAKKRMSKIHEYERERGILILEMMDTYLHYRTQKVEEKKWILECEKIVEQMIKLHTGNLIGRLYQANILLRKDRANEAKWILSHIGDMFENGQGNDMEYAYYLYLTSEYGQNVEKDEILEELKKIAEKNPNDFRIYYLLQRCDKTRKENKEQKYKDMESMFYRGVNSPIMYLEAYECLQRKSELFVELGLYEIQILRFAAKYRILTEDIAKRVTVLALRSKESSKAVLTVLEECYQAFPMDETLQAICSLLIHNTCTDERYFSYFEKAVKKNLRLTRLYEYYMFTLDLREKKRIPKAVFMFFAFECHLDYEKKAYLFACACRQKEELGELFSAYEMQIMEFIKDQIMKLHINDELAYLYERYLGDISFDEAMANQFVKMVFKYKISTHRDDVRNVVVVHEQLKDEKIYPIADKQAYASVYTGDFCILLEDENHNRSVVSTDWQLEPVLLYKKLLYLLNNFEIKHLGFHIYLCEEKKTYAVVDESNVGAFSTLLLNPQVNDEYRQGIGRRLLKFYFEHDHLDELRDVFAKLPLQNVHPDDRDDLLRYMFALELYDRAYEFVLRHGVEYVSPKTLSRICCRQLQQEKQELVNQNGNLLWLCFEVFKKRKAGSEILAYLVENFDGTLKQMKDIWLLAKEKQLETRKLEKRILTQFLYSGGYLSMKDDIFYSYGEAVEGVDDLTRAYIAKSCYDYFVKDFLVGEKLFGAVLQFVHGKEELPVVCKLAFIKYFAQIKSKNEKISLEEKRVIVDFLNDLIQKKYFFSFFFVFKEWVPIMQTCMDRTYVEYRAEPGCKVTIHYLLAANGKHPGDYEKMPMREMYDGYYSAGFGLFFSQQLQYYITKEKDGIESLVESGTVEKLDAADMQKETRFSLLNDILVSRALQDQSTTMQLMNEYGEKVWMTESLLTLM